MNIDKTITLKAQEIIKKCVSFNEKGMPKVNCCYDDTMDDTMTTFYDGYLPYQNDYSIIERISIDFDNISMWSMTFGDLGCDMHYLYTSKKSYYLIKTRDKELIKECYRLLIIHLVRGMF